MDKTMRDDEQSLSTPKDEHNDLQNTRRKREAPATDGEAAGIHTGIIAKYFHRAIPINRYDIKPHPLTQYKDSRNIISGLQLPAGSLDSGNYCYRHCLSPSVQDEWTLPSIPGEILKYLYFKSPITGSIVVEQTSDGDFHISQVGMGHAPACSIRDFVSSLRDTDLVGSSQSPDYFNEAMALDAGVNVSVAWDRKELLKKVWNTHFITDPPMDIKELAQVVEVSGWFCYLPFVCKKYGDIHTYIRLYGPTISCRELRTLIHSNGLRSRYGHIEPGGSPGVHHLRYDPSSTPLAEKLDTLYSPLSRTSMPNIRFGA
ncbi:hypothetical protein IW262DRAFT_463123 [Armillaria fumosa]|nr:hypothetical protein IW262DRAFT_463123 [Armillaria fumosa]